MLSRAVQELFSRATEAGQAPDSSLIIAIVSGVIGGLAMIAVIILFVVLLRHKRKTGDKHDEENGNLTFEEKGITQPPMAYNGVYTGSDSMTTISLDEGAYEKPALSVSVNSPSSEGSPPMAKKWKHKRVPVPRFSRLSSASQKSSARSWLGLLPLSPHFSRRSSRGSARSGISSPSKSDIPPLPVSGDKEDRKVRPLPQAPSLSSASLPPTQEQIGEDGATLGKPSLTLSIPP